MTRDNFGDRMKEYESIETGRKFLPRLPIVCRIDGRGFSKFTRGMERPYDERMSASMVETTKTLVENTHATIGYTQSDEISLVWIPSENGSGWFDGKIFKMTSVLAGLSTSAFCKSLFQFFGTEAADLLDKLPHFDCRVINLPNESETANMLLWRNLDATKNAVSMAAHHYYSHRDLQGKTSAEKQEMLFAKGINFNDYPAFFKRGIFARRITVQRQFTAVELAAIPEKHRPKPDSVINRSEIDTFDLPPLNKIANLTDVLFRSAEVQSRTT